MLPPPLPRDYVDRVLRGLWRHGPTPMLRLALAQPDLTVHQVIDTGIVSVSRAADGAALAEDEHGPFIGHVEYETDARRRCLQRLALVGLWLHERYDLPVRSALVALEPSPLDDDRFVMSHGPQELCRYHFTLVRVYQLPAAELVRNPQLAALAPLGAGATPETVLVALRQIRTLGPTQRGDLLASLYILCDRRFGGELIRHLVTQEELMESQFLRELVEESYEKGFQKGMDQGISQGGREAVASTLRRLIALRFPESLSSLEAILSLCTLEDLEAAAEALLLVSSGEELRQFLLARRAH